MVPLVVPLADEGLVVAERVPGVAAEGHRRPDAEGVAMPTAVHRDAGVEAGVRLQRHTWTGPEQGVTTLRPRIPEPP